MGFNKLSHPEPRNSASLDPYKVEKARHIYMLGEHKSIFEIARACGLKEASVKWLRDSNGWAEERDDMIIRARYGNDLKKAYSQCKQLQQFTRTVLETSVRTARQTTLAAKKNKKILSARQVKDLQNAIDKAKADCLAARLELAMVKRCIARKTSGKPGRNWMQTNTAPNGITAKMLGEIPADVE